MIFVFDGQSVPFTPGQTVAAALWQAGVRSWRTTRVAGAPRGLFCGIGACFECLATVDGSPNERLCVTTAQGGMTVSSVPERTPSRRILASKDSFQAPQRYDVAVVGAGPAGLAAAATASLAGARVALIDSAPRVGGQFWRHREDESGGHGYRDWSVLVGLRSLVEERVDHIPDATVWFIEPGFTLHTTAGRFAAGRVVLATGAYDRALPFPGWDLPGVMTPGAAQALLKGSGVAAGRRVVVAGAGPFLLPVAVGLAEAGVHVVGVFEAGHPRSYLRRPTVVARVGTKLGEAAGYAAALARHRVPYRLRHAVINAQAGPDDRVSHVDIARLDGDGAVLGSFRVGCDAVAVGYGFTANLELALSLGCGVKVGADGGLAVLVGRDGQTTVRDLYAAGELAGVGGAALAVVEGELAGAAAARAAGAGSALSTRDTAAAHRKRDRLRAFADVMHAAHAVPQRWADWLTGQTLVCRCEEVPVDAVTAAVSELGATRARTVKQLARPGMGWCQGRVCGYATAALTARACDRPMLSEDLIAMANRPFATPVRLADLALLDDLENDGPSRI